MLEAIVVVCKIMNKIVRDINFNLICKSKWSLYGVGESLIDNFCINFKLPLGISLILIVFDIAENSPVKQILKKQFSE